MQEPIPNGQTLNLSTATSTHAKGRSHTLRCMISYNGPLGEPPGGLPGEPSGASWLPGSFWEFLGFPGTSGASWGSVWVTFLGPPRCGKSSRHARHLSDIIVCTNLAPPLVRLLRRPEQENNKKTTCCATNYHIISNNALCDKRKPG